MSAEEIVKLARGLFPILIGAGFVFVEIINAVKGSEFYTIKLLREFKNIIIGIIRELGSEDWLFKLNAFLCIALFLFVLCAFFLLIRSIFISTEQLVIFALLIYGLVSFLSEGFKISVGLITVYG